MRVAVLGTGIMGTGMARSALRAGLDVAVWNRTAQRAAPLAEDGAAVAASIGEAVDGADVVVTMLFDLAATLQAKDEIRAAMGPQAVWLQSATVGPAGIERIAAGVDRILDAPVVGTKQPAEDGTLVMLAAGAAELVDRARPVLDAMGSRTVVAGDRIGQASALKLACNAWIATITAGAAQSLALAAALGADPAAFLQVIGGGAADSPYAQLKGRQMLENSYPAAFALDGLVKDLGLMREAAAPVGFPDTLLAALAELFGRASEQGHGDEDIAAVRLAFGD